MKQSKEIWKDVIGYEGLYQVSSKGRVKSLDRVMISSSGYMYKVKCKIMIPRKHPKGYMRVQLMNVGKRKERTVHSLMAESFMGHVRNGMKLVVNHKDNDRGNNVLDNLEITTNKKNTDRKHIIKSNKHSMVHYNKNTCMWVSNMYKNTQHSTVGKYKTEEEAINSLK